MADNDPFNRRSRLTEDFYNSNGAYSPRMLNFLEPPSSYSTAVDGSLGRAFGSAPAPALTGANTAFGQTRQSYAGLAQQPLQDFAGSVQQFGVDLKQFGRGVGREASQFFGQTLPQIGYNIQSALPQNIQLGQQPFAGPAPESVLASKLGIGGPSSRYGEDYRNWENYAPPGYVPSGMGPEGPVGGRILGAGDEEAPVNPLAGTPQPDADTGGGGEDDDGTGWRQVWKNGKLKWVLIRNRKNQAKKNEAEAKRNQQALRDGGQRVTQSLNWRVASG